MNPTDAPRGNSGPFTPQQWADLRSLVDQALALSGQERSAFLDEKCGNDKSLYDRVKRLVASCEQSDESWRFLAQPVGELVAPMLIADAALDSNPRARAHGLPPAFYAAIADRYAVGAEIGRGGMATVYVAEDLRHQRRVAIKVLDSTLGAMLGAERFLAEIRVTASLQQPNLLPLFDSGEAAGLLYYVMPLIEGATLRARLQRERQLPVDEALRIVCAVAGALDYAHRQGVVHRDLKPENILLHDGQPLLADFGIAVAVARSGGAHLTAPGISLGTPEYMSPEQATSNAAVDGRSDIFSLACVLYELLVGDPPFAGSNAQTIKARVLADAPSSVRTVRPSVPVYVEAALTRALAKLPADRFATAREFADALITAPIALPASAPAPAARRRARIRIGLGLTGAAVVVGAAWIATSTPAAPPQRFYFSDLLDQSLSGTVTITPDGGALVYTGPADAGRPFIMLSLTQRPKRTLAGSEGGRQPVVAPDGRRLVFATSDNVLRTVPIEGPAASDNAVRQVLRRLFRKTEGWRYGNGAWIGDSATVSAVGQMALVKRELGRSTQTVLTHPDTAHGELRHQAPLVLPGARAVIFTVTSRGGPRVLKGPLAIASLNPAGDSLQPHRLLGISARRAIAFVDGWLLYISLDGAAIMAIRLDVARGQVVGSEISVLEDEVGNLETGSLADNGTLLYVRRPRTNSPVLVDFGGGVHSLLPGSERTFMHPRYSPDGKHFAVQVTTPDLGTDDVWVYDMASRTPLQITTTGRAQHPAWTPDGRNIVYWITASREIMSQQVAGGATADTVVRTRLSFSPTVAPDGRSVLFQRGTTGTNNWSIWTAQLSPSSAPRKVLDEPFSNYEPAVSPRDGRWLAYTSTATGQPEVYVRPFPGPGRAVQVSDSGGSEPAWSLDGREIYYRTRGALVAAAVTTPALAITSRRQLIRGAFAGDMWHRNYDVAPDGSGFLMIAPAGNPEAVVVLDWLAALRARLAHAR